MEVDTIQFAQRRNNVENLLQYKKVGCTDLFSFSIEAKRSI